MKNTKERFNRKNILDKKDRNEFYGMFTIGILMVIFFGCMEYYLLFQIIFYVYLILLVIIVYAQYKRKYNNIKQFCCLLFLLVIVFPVTHDLLFRFTKNNYTLSEDYLNHKKNEISNSLLEYNDTDQLLIISNSLPSNILNLVYKESLIGKRYHYKNGSVLIAPELIGSDVRDRDRRPNYRIDFYNLKAIKMASIKIKKESIIEGIYSKINERKVLEYELLKPETTIHYSDIWLDSTTIFIFSNIRPIGKATQILQFLQVVTSFLFVYMLTTFLDNFKQLKITIKYDNTTENNEVFS